MQDAARGPVAWGNQGNHWRVYGARRRPCSAMWNAWA